MQLTELRTFLAIIETGSLVRASERLNVTQSTVTARLKSLESELGQVLINRQKSGASMTAAGVRLQRYATTISELWQQARRETALPHGFSSVLNIGCHPDLWTGAGDQLFAFIKNTLPQAAVSINTGNDENLVAWLANGKIDLALTYSPHDSHNCQSLQIFEERLVLVSTTENSPVRFNPDYVFVEAGEDFGRQHAAAYSDANTARINFSTAQLGLEYLTLYGGSAYLPERLVKPRLESGEWFELPDAPTFTRRAYVTFNDKARQSWPWWDSCLQRTFAIRID